MANVEQYSDPVLERNALSALLRDPNGAIQYIPNVQPFCFTDENLRRLYIVIKRFVDESGTSPTGESLRVQLSVMYPKKSSEDIVAAILSTYTSLLSSKDSTPTSFLVNSLIQFSRARQMLTSMERSLKLLDNGQLTESIKEYEENALSLSALDPTVIVTRGDVVADFEKRKDLIRDMKLHPDKYRGVLTGIDEIDLVTGGLWKGELGFVFGKSGVGKSFFLLEMAYNAFLAKERVLVIPIEMPMIQWARRFDARISHVSYEKLKWATVSDGELDQWEKRMLQIRGQYSNTGAAVFISHIPIGCTTTAIRVELERLIRLGTPATMLAVDYADLMSPSGTFFSEQESLGAIFADLKGLAMAYQVPIWTASQARREAYTKSSLEMSDVGYSLKKVMTSDLVIGIAQTDADRLANRLVLNIVKYRDGTYSKPIYLKPDLSIGMISAVGV